MELYLNWRERANGGQGAKQSERRAAAIAVARRSSLCKVSCPRIHQRSEAAANCPAKEFNNPDQDMAGGDGSSREVIALLRLPSLLSVDQKIARPGYSPTISRLGAIT